MSGTQSKPLTSAELYAAIAKAAREALAAPAQQQPADATAERKGGE